MTKALPRIRAQPTREYDHDAKTIGWQGAGRTATADVPFDMQFNAIFGNSSQMPAISRRFTKTTANSRKFQNDPWTAVADA
jgi:hypothetical protein